MRDFQRAKVYRAEEYVFSKAMQLDTIQLCEMYTSSVWDDPRFKEKFPRAHKGGPPPVKHSPRMKGGALAYFAPNEKISLSSKGMTDLVVIHEIAHIVVEREHQTDDESRIFHGPEWVDTYIKLTEMFVGRPVAVELTDALLAENVRFTYQINNTRYARPLGYASCRRI